MWYNELAGGALLFVGGLVTSTAIMAFAIALGVISKLRRRAGTKVSPQVYGIIFAAGAVCACCAEFFRLRLEFPLLNVVSGLFSGAFIGVFLLCLAEVVSVLPRIYKAVPRRAVFYAVIVAFGVGKALAAISELALAVFS